jgi:hypothetical protein
MSKVSYKYSKVGVLSVFELSSFKGRSMQCENLIVAGKQIRFVHIPDKINVAKVLEDHVSIISMLEIRKLASSNAAIRSGIGEY